MLPRTEVWVRLPSYYRGEHLHSPQRIAGLGVGAMYQFTVETLHVPALALRPSSFNPSAVTRFRHRTRSKRF